MSWDANTVIAVSTIVTAIATGCIALFTWYTAQIAKANLKTAEAIGFFTGAMESHSNLHLAIEAARGVKGEPIECVWWDPTLEAPPSTAGHGQPVTLKRIYMFVPREKRRGATKAV